MNKFSTTPRTLTFVFSFLAYVGICLLLAAPAHADPVPVTVQQVVAIRTRLQTAINEALPAVQCRPGVTASVINVGGGTRVVACGSLPDYEAALMQFLGTTVAELIATRPSQATLETAVLFTDYLESLANSRRAPVEITFASERIVASARR